MEPPRRWRSQWPRKQEEPVGVEPLSLPPAWKVAAVGSVVEGERPSVPLPGITHLQIAQLLLSTSTLTCLSLQLFPWISCFYNLLML